MIKAKLLETRLNKGMSQEELADLIGMTQSNYSRREKGLKRISDIEWTRLSKALKVEKEDIYEEEIAQNIVYKNIKGNNSINNSGSIHYFNVPDFVLEHIEILKQQNVELKQKIAVLEKQLTKES